MKKQWIGLLLATPLSLLAFSIQGDVSYFRPTASVLREVYGEGWIDYKIEFNQPASYNHWFWKRLSVFADISYLGKGGHSVGGDYRTHIRIVPISLGLKWIQPISDDIDIYLGAAPRYFFLHIHDHLSVVKEKINKNGMGGMLIFGFNLYLWKELYVDLFSSYSFKHFNKPSTPAHVKGHSLQVGGLDVGGGFGWRF